MKIKLKFIQTPGEAPAGTISMILGNSWQEEDLCRLSRQDQRVLIAGPRERSGQYGMVCAVEGQLYFQSMCFPSDSRYSPGEDVIPIPTPWGKIALCCEEDIFQSMYPRTAALKGCCLLAARVSRLGALLIPGPWSACQSNCLPIALAETDRGQLILPCAMTSDGSGFGSSDIDTAALRQAYREFPIFRSLNKALYRRYEEVLTL